MIHGCPHTSRKDEDIQVFTDLITGINDSGESGVKIISDDDLKNYIKAVESRKQITAENEEALIFAKAELSLRERISAEEKRQAKIEAELAEKEQNKKSEMKAQEHIDSVTKALADQPEAMR